MPGYAHGISDSASHIASFMKRTFVSSKRITARDRQLAIGSPVLVVLGTKADDQVSWLEAGQALGMMVLTARSESGWTSFMNQPIEAILRLN